MAVTVSKTERSSKRRKLSPPDSSRANPSKKSQKAQAVTPSDEPVNEAAVSKPDPPTSTSTLPQQDLPTISVKGLDSSEPSVRRASLKSILEHLSTRPPSHPLTPTQCLQLWRGFFVAIYMHDSKNTLSVQNLLGEIARTFATMAAKDDDDEASTESESHPWLTPYHQAFHETLVREWAGIDSHRMNKYLLLVRFVLRELFTLCFKPLYTENTKPATARQSPKTKTKTAKKVALQTSYDALKARALSTTDSIVSTLESAGPLNPSNRKIPDGLRLHILDIWTTELFGALNDLQQAMGESQDDAMSLQRLDDTKVLVETQRASLERVAKGDSGAQRHVRLRAKEALKDSEEQLGAFGL